MKNILSFLRNNYIQIYKGFIFSVVVLAIVYMLPREAKFYYEYQLDRPWKYESLIAVDDIPLLKTDEELKNEQEELSKNITRYYYFDSIIDNKIHKKADRNFDTLWLISMG
ncbi:MAG: hypothetical protein JXR34_09580, partial [Bacteroidales bacterium]|nr:hypothetical protein [Bacteroidales bacterium]